MLTSMPPLTFQGLSSCSLLSRPVAALDGIRSARKDRDKPLWLRAHAVHDPLDNPPLILLG